MIRVAWASVADCAITPLQDVLGLGNEARMNLPGTETGNWSWRFTTDMLAADRLALLAELTATYGRLANPVPRAP
jgi:4-alpha-glucanotransferase